MFCSSGDSLRNEGGLKPDNGFIDNLEGALIAEVDFIDGSRAPPTIPEGPEPEAGGKVS